MNLSWILIIVLILILLGGVGPAFYSGAPWQTGYGTGYGGISVLGVLIIILLVAVFTGHFG